MRPLSLIRPPAWAIVARATAGSGWQRLGGSWPRWSPSGECGCGQSCPGLEAAVLGHRGKGGLGGGERVVAELGQDVAGLPEDLAGLGQGGALAVLAVLGAP